MEISKIEQDIIMFELHNDEEERVLTDMAKQAYQDAEINISPVEEKKEVDKMNIKKFLYPKNAGWMDLRYGFGEVGGPMALQMDYVKGYAVKTNVALVAENKKLNTKLYSFNAEKYDAVHKEGSGRKLVEKLYSKYK